MRILLIGATGTIGKAIAAALSRRHEVLFASRQQAPLHVDIADPASIRSLYAHVGKVGAVISAAGQARFKPLDELLMFPIHNEKGKIIAYGGRALAADDDPKYLNSAETPI